VREFILKLKLGSVRPSYYQEKFGRDPLAFFAPQLKTLEAEGYGSVHEDEVRLNRHGLLQVDRLLHDFFLPQHRQFARYT
jgi:oxygen-independent coproporphyrinogen III oxidase